MSTILLLILAVTSSYLPKSPMVYLQENTITNKPVYALRNLVPPTRTGTIDNQSFSDLSMMLHHEEPALNSLVIDKVLTALKCVSQYNIEHNHILTIIDYSLPSNQKRLWVFDLNEKKLLFYTYVSHGIKSGTLLSNYFSNKFNSKASSIGVYQTEKTYYGRDGLSLRLDGLDRSFNDNASNRSVVMHSGWYVDEDFIKKYGRPGRSWGCPALPMNISQAVINTIKDKSLLVIYYPSDSWFLKSKFLNCDKISAAQYAYKLPIEAPLTVAPDDQRDAILFVNNYKGSRHSESEPVAVMPADIYQRVFNTQAPLTRMLRRQINNAEYIALSTAEFNYLALNSKLIQTDYDVLDAIYFVIPVIKMVHGYYETQMQIVNLGKITEIKINSSSSRENKPATSYTVYFAGKPAVNLNATNQFIRWVGL